jgi:hypothetical protein
MGIFCEFGENSILTHRQDALHLVKTHVAGIDQFLVVSPLDIVEKFCRIKLGTAGDKLIPDV